MTEYGPHLMLSILSPAYFFLTKKYIDVCDCVVASAITENSKHCNPYVTSQLHLLRLRTL